MLVLQLKKAYRWIQALSLDVVLGCGLLSHAIARYYGVSLPFTAVLALMVAVWAIYTFDHLLDARRIGRVGRRASSYRHRFHQQHHKALKIALFLAILAGVGLTFLLPPVVVRWGLACTVFVAFYFLLLNLYALRYKELLISICYTVGVFLAPVSLAGGDLSFFQWLLIPQVLLIALTNLIVLSYFEKDADQQDGSNSIAVSLGQSRSRKIAMGLIMAGLIICGVLFLSASFTITREMQLLIFTMNLMHLILLLRENNFRQHGLYRIIGDAIFFIPALFLLYAR